MAKPGKSWPWVIEFKPADSPKWYVFDAFRDRERAQLEMTLAKKSVGHKATLRIRNFNEPQPAPKQLTR